MIFNPMLNENVFEFPNFRFEEKEIQNPHFNRRNTDSNKKKMETYFNDIINKCKEKVKLLNEENGKLKKSLIHYENIQKNYEQEKTNYMKKLLNNKNNLNELQKKINNLNQINKEFENKIKLLENENCNIKKDFENYKNNNVNEIKEELNYKNSIIKYLENLLKRTSINPKLYNEESYKNELQRYNIQNNEKNINYLKGNKLNQCENYNIQNIKEDISQNNKNINSMEKDSLLNIDNENNKKKLKKDDILYEKDDIKENKPKKIKKEIDSLDKEINDLQNKLKKMLNK